MDIILASVRCKVTLVYLEDVILLSETIETTSRTSKPSHSYYAAQECHKEWKMLVYDHVDYFSHVTLPEKLAVSSKTCESVKKLKP